MNIKPKAYFNLSGEYVDFDHVTGMLSAQSGTMNPVVLTEEQTKQLFIAMRNHYLVNKDKFWEE